MAKAASILVTSLTGIARFLKLSEFAISFILMATATSLPELFVGINAALKGQSTIVLGNVIGSNIADLTFVIGIAVLIARTIRIKSQIAKRDSLYMLFLGGAPLILILDGQVTRLEGVALIFLYLFYISRLLIQKKDFSATLDSITGKKAFYSLLNFLVGVGILIIASRIMITAAEEVAIGLKLPLSFIGLVLVAVGTSIPELIFEIQAVKKFHTDLMLGDIMGSVATNMTFILGLTAVISPIQIKTPMLFYTSSIILILIMIIFNLFLRSKQKLETYEAVLLVLLYIIFLFLEFGVGINRH